MPIDLNGIILFTVEELAEKLDVNENTIRQYLKEGKLRGRKLGVKWFVSTDNIREYFNSDSAETYNEEDH